MRFFNFLLVTILAFGCNKSEKSTSSIVSEIISKVNKVSGECDKLDVLDAEMQQLVSDIKIKYRAEKTFGKRFEMSQVYWIQYRDRHVKALYPLNWNNHYRKNYSTNEFNECKCKENNRMTLNRIEELAVFLEPDRNQSDCPTIWNE